MPELPTKVIILIHYITLQSMMYAKLGHHRFWPCHENGLFKTIQTKPHNLFSWFKLAPTYYGLKLIKVYSNPQLREADLKLTYIFLGVSFESS